MLFQFILAFSMFVLFVVILWRAVGKATVKKVCPKTGPGSPSHLRARIKELQSYRANLMRKQVELFAVQEQVESAQQEIEISAELAAAESELQGLIARLNEMKEIRVDY